MNHRVRRAAALGGATLLLAACGQSGGITRHAAPKPVYAAATTARPSPVQPPATTTPSTPNPQHTDQSGPRPAHTSAPAPPKPELLVALFEHGTTRGGADYVESHGQRHLRVHVTGLSKLARQDVSLFVAGRRCATLRVSAAGKIIGTVDTRRGERLPAVHPGSKVEIKTSDGQVVVNRALDDAPVSGEFALISLPEEHRTSVTMCGSGDRAIVGRPHQPPFFIRNAFWQGKGPACLRTDGRPSFQVLQTPSAARDVVAYPDITRGCHWGHCTSDMELPVQVSQVRSLQSYASTRGRPWGTWNKAYDMWFSREPLITSTAHPDGTELMIWNDQHGICCTLASDAVKVRIDGKWWWRSHWVMKDRSNDHRYHGIRWNHVQYRLVHSRAAVHVDIADFMRDAERIGSIRPSWWLDCAEYGFEVWWGGAGLQLTDFRLHLQTFPTGLPSAARFGG